MTFSPSTLLRPRQWPPGLILVIAVLALVLVVFVGCQMMPRQPRDPFRTAEVSRGPLQRTVSASGTLQALVTVQVGSQVSGQVRDVLVDFNSRVRRGDILAIIDPDTFSSRMESARADLGASTAVLAQQQAALAQAEAQLALDESTLRRTQQLANQGYASRAALDQAEATARRSRAAVANARAGIGAQRARVVQSQATVRSAAVDLNRTRIISPIDGVVVSRQIDPGQTVAASFQAPVLFQIAQDLSQLQVKVMVDEADIGQVREGQTMTFTVDAFPDDNFSGTVTQVRMQPETQANVVAYVVIAEAANPNGRLMPGMTANADILIERRPNVLQVPNAALRFTPADQRAQQGGPQVRIGGPGMGGPGFGGGGGRNRDQGRGQGGRERGARMGLGTALQSPLNLNDRQVQQINDISRESRRSMMQNRGNPAALQTARAERDRRILPLLNEQQRAQYPAAVARIDAFTGGRRGAGGMQLGTVYVVGPNNRPRAIQVRVGATNGTNTEIVPVNPNELREGTQIIIGGGPRPSVRVNAPIPGGGQQQQRR